ncbi:MAG: hypothetical protein QOI34_340 [Verrucomicrobiota bacterium]|jgi:hypothetical protein
MSDLFREGLQTLREGSLGQRDYELPAQIHGPADSLPRVTPSMNRST